MQIGRLQSTMLRRFSTAYSGKSCQPLEIDQLAPIYDVPGWAPGLPKQCEGKLISLVKTKDESTKINAETDEIAVAGSNSNAGRLSIIGSSSPAIQTVAQAALEYSGAPTDALSDLSEAPQAQVLNRLSAEPAEVTTAIVSNASVVELINDDVIRPLDKLVAALGSEIPKHQLIKINGKVMAVAFMADAQHVAYRSDILNQIEVDAPASYSDLLEVAEKIREMGIMEHPLGGTYSATDDLAQEFTNLFIGAGGEFFEPGTAKPTINNAHGAEALSIMKALTAFMHPDYLTQDAQAEWAAGNTAVMNIWGSQANALINADSDNLTALGGPLRVGESDIPATTLWWTGWTIAKNISDEDAELAFLAMKQATSPSLLNDETMGQAVWLMEGFVAQAEHMGVLASVAAGATPYPMVPFQNLLHSAIGEKISDFLQGDATAEQTLADIEAAYLERAKENGIAT